MKPVVIVGLLVAMSSAASLADEPYSPTAGPLYQKILALDKAAFDAFNACTDPAQLAKHASFFVKELESYHDNGGASWTRDAYVRGVRDNVCGKFRRELDVESFRVWPIKDFGAISQGTHRFCHTPSTCEGVGQFTMIWREKDGQWRVTRVMSYDHRADHRPAAGH
ncbi:MAG: nuclear transport factor 2 family protein [Pseudomonadota bacterium]